MDAVMVNHLINRLNEVMGNDAPLIHLNVGDDSINYKYASHTPDEAYALVVALLDMAKIEQDRRGRIIAWAEDELQLGGEDGQEHEPR